MILVNTKEWFGFLKAAIFISIDISVIACIIINILSLYNFKKIQP